MQYVFDERDVTAFWTVTRLVDITEHKNRGLSVRAVAAETGISKSGIGRKLLTLDKVIYDIYKPTWPLRRPTVKILAGTMTPQEQAERDQGTIIERPIDDGDDGEEHY